MKYTIEEMADILAIPVPELCCALQATGMLSPDDTAAQGWQTEEPARIRSVVLRHYASRLEQVSRCTLPDPSLWQEPAPEVKAAAESQEALLDRLVRERVIMIDTCTLMHESCETLVEKLLPPLRRYHKTIYLPLRVIEELRQHSWDQNDRTKACRASRAYRLCKKLQEEGCLSVRGSRRDNFADNVFFVLFSRYRYRCRLLLITQDRKLTMDILQLNRTQSSAGYPVEVMHMDRDGALQAVGTLEQEVL